MCGLYMYLYRLLFTSGPPTVVHVDAVGDGHSYTSFTLSWPYLSEWIGVIQYMYIHVHGVIHVCTCIYMFIQYIVSEWGGVIQYMCILCYTCTCTCTIHIHDGVNMHAHTCTCIYMYIQYIISEWGCVIQYMYMYNTYMYIYIRMVLIYMYMHIQYIISEWGSVIQYMCMYIHDVIHVCIYMYM